MRNSLGAREHSMCIFGERKCNSFGNSEYFCVNGNKLTPLPTTPPKHRVMLPMPRPLLSLHSFALILPIFPQNNRCQPSPFIVSYQTDLPMCPLTLLPFLTAQKRLSPAHGPVTPPVSGPHALQPLVCVHIFTRPPSLPDQPPASPTVPTPLSVPIAMESCS